MIESDIFEPFERLVEIEILGERKSVPENNSLLRCFQFLAMNQISYGDFCWNGTCANCEVSLGNTESSRPVLACRTTVEKNMKIVKLSGQIKFEE